VTKRLAAVVVYFSLATAIYANPIQVTNGVLYTDQFALWDTCVSVPAFHILNRCTESAFSLHPNALAQGQAVTRHYVSEVTVAGVVYPGPEPGGPPFSIDPTNLNMTFMFAPVPNVSPMPVAGQLIIPDVYSQPFTMVGTLGMFDPSTGDPIIFDVVGQGTLDRFWRLATFGSPGGTVGVTPVFRAEFTFTAPEQSSLILLGIALGPLLALTYRRSKGRKPNRLTGQNM
jgi:hypothetical protein